MHDSRMKTQEVLCSVQRALLGAVTPNLRAVTVSIEKVNTFNLYIYYNEELSEEESELTSLTYTYFTADFPPPKYETHLTIEILPFPSKIPEHGRSVYERYEHES